MMYFILYQALLLFLQTTGVATAETYNFPILWVVHVNGCSNLWNTSIICHQLQAVYRAGKHRLRIKLGG